MQSDFFSHRTTVSYYETDAMGVVHHSNYLRYFEDARVAFLRARNINQYHAQDGGVVFGVLESHLSHLRPARFDDPLEVRLQVRVEGARIRFEYAIASEKYNNEFICLGTTVHVPLDSRFQPCRIPKPILTVLEREPWKEIWP